MFQSIIIENNNIKENTKSKKKRIKKWINYIIGNEKDS